MNPLRFGLISGLSLIISLGPQNIFLIQQGLRRNYVFWVALVCFACDAVLIVASASGMSQLVLGVPALKTSLQIGGAAFLLYYASVSARSAYRRIFYPSLMNFEEDGRLTLVGACLTAVTFSLVNPQAIIDTLMIIGGLTVNFAPQDQSAFIMGVLLASMLWFFTIATSTYWFTRSLQRQSVWIGLDVCSSVLMVYFAFRIII